MKMLWLVITSMVYIYLLNFIYFYKKRYSSLENNIFKILMLSNIVGLWIELGCFITIYVKDKYPLLNSVFTRGLLIYYFLWIMIFTLYVFVVSYKNKYDEKTFNIKFKKVKLISLVACILLTPFLTILPIEYYFDGVKAYSYGASVLYLNALYAALMIIWMFMILKNKKEIRSKKFIPIFIFIILGFVVGIIQRTYPWMTLMTGFHTFLVFTMFFTIENPDLQLLGELQKNRELIDQTLEDRSNLLFNISQELRVPAVEINKICNNLNAVNKDDVERLKMLSSELNFVINDVLGIKTVSSLALNSFKNNYSIYNLLKVLELKTKNQLEGRDVKYLSHVDKSIPEKVFGEENIIKQVLTTIIDNSIKYTKTGFIELNCSSYVKYDRCRFIITVSDSGTGIPIEKVNNYINDTQDISDDELKMLDKLNLNITLVNKLIRYIGGSIMINSEIGKGTKFTITFEQEIVENKDRDALYETSKKIASIFRNKKIIILSDKKDELLEIKKEFEKNDVSVTTTMFLEDLINKLNQDNSYSLCLIENDIKLLNGYNSMKKIKENSNIKCVMLLDKDNKKIRNVLIEDGCTDVLIKNKLSEETVRIIDKYM